MKKVTLAICLLIMTYSLFAGDWINLVVVDNKVNIRSEPNLKSEILTQVNLGDILHGNFVSNDKININNYAGFWFQVVILGKGKGYVWGQYAKPFLDEVKSKNDIIGQIFALDFRLGQYGGIIYNLKDIAILKNKIIAPVKFVAAKLKEISKLRVWNSPKTVDTCYTA